MPPCFRRLVCSLLRKSWMGWFRDIVNASGYMRFQSWWCIQKRYGKSSTRVLRVEIWPRSWSSPISDRNTMQFPWFYLKWLNFLVLCYLMSYEFPFGLAGSVLICPFLGSTPMNACWNHFPERSWKLWRRPWRRLKTSGRKAIQWYSFWMRGKKIPWGQVQVITQR